MKLLKFLAGLTLVALVAGCGPIKNGVNPEPDPNTFGGLMKLSGWGVGYTKTRLPDGRILVHIPGDKCQAVLQISPGQPNPTPSATPAWVSPPYFRAVAVAAPGKADQVAMQPTEKMQGFEKDNPTPDDFQTAVDVARKAKLLTVC